MKKRTQTAEPTAAQIMTKHIEMVRGSDPISQVARLFSDQFIGAAAVTDSQGRPVGVITKTDLIRYQQGLGSGVARSIPDNAADWMTGVIFAVKPETLLRELASRMVRYGIHHMFVRKPQEEKLLGIVSSFDILRAIAK